MVRKRWPLRIALQIFNSHSLTHVTLANDEIASGRVGPVHRILTSISALPSKLGILVGPVLGSESLLSLHELRDLTLDELCVTSDRTKSRSCSDTGSERGDSQD